MSISWASSRRLPSNSNWTRKLVRSSPGSARRVAANFSRPSIIAGTSAMALVYSSLSGGGHDRVEEVGVQLPVVVGQTHQPHGEDGRDRAGVVEHEVHLAVGDPLVEEPVHRLLHERPHLLDGARREERGERPPQAPGGRGRRPRRCPVAVGLRDAEHPSRPGSPRRRRRSVRTCARRCRRRGRPVHRVVAGDEPESAVLLVPRDRAPAAQLGVDRRFVEVELVGVVIEVDDHVGADVGRVAIESPPTRRELFSGLALSLHYYASPRTGRLSRKDRAGGE